MVRWIYYGSNASGRSEIWKIPAAGGTPVRLTTDGGFEPRESPDGRTIYYVDARVGNGLASPRPRSNKSRRLAALKRSSSPASRPARGM